MPFRSQKQRKYLFANKPAVARKFASHGRATSKRSGKKKRGK